MRVFKNRTACLGNCSVFFFFFFIMRDIQPVAFVLKMNEVHLEDILVRWM